MLSNFQCKNNAATTQINQETDPFPFQIQLYILQQRVGQQ